MNKVLIIKTYRSQYSWHGTLRDIPCNYEKYLNEKQLLFILNYLNIKNLCEDSFVITSTYEQFSFILEYLKRPNQLTYLQLNNNECKFLMEKIL